MAAEIAAVCNRDTQVTYMASERVNHFSQIASPYLTCIFIPNTKIDNNLIKFPSTSFKNMRVKNLISSLPDHLGCCLSYQSRLACEASHARSDSHPWS